MKPARPEVTSAVPSESGVAPVGASDEGGRAMSVEMLVSTNAACALDNDGEVIGIYELGHVPPWGLRRYDWEEHSGGDLWPAREWWRDVPYSIQYPDEPPCGGGEESILFVPCKKTDAGAYPVTVIRYFPAPKSESREAGR